MKSTASIVLDTAVRGPSRRQYLFLNDFSRIFVFGLVEKLCDCNAEKRKYKFTGELYSPDGFSLTSWSKVQAQLIPISGTRKGVSTLQTTFRWSRKKRFNHLKYSLLDRSLEPDIYYMVGASFCQKTRQLGPEIRLFPEEGFVIKKN